ncbi:chromatin modification-related protein EAF7-domain-containing protein [Boletus coccyginus]|nr:chromatin modification-related protein EAF7-domain-containing protein [Boletus coccyginus]
MDNQTPDQFLDSVEGEISLFRSVMRARPVGIHKHFHVLAIRNAIHNDTGRVIPVESIWTKLRTCYDLEALENATQQDTDGFDNSGPYPQMIRSPSPSENLSRHPFFREEFALPMDEMCESLVAVRRVRATASIPSSTPAPSPRQASKARKSKAPKRNRNKADMAGLVGGDSDSSALTQESGDEAVFTPRDSVVTGTDAGTDYEDDPEVQEASPASVPPKVGRGGRVSKSGRGGTAGRGRAGSTGLGRGGGKKRKK